MVVLPSCWIFQLSIFVTFDAAAGGTIDIEIDIDTVELIVIDCHGNYSTIYNIDTSTLRKIIMNAY